MESKKDNFAMKLGWVFFAAAILVLAGGIADAIAIGRNGIAPGYLIIWCTWLVTGMVFWVVD